MSKVPIIGSQVQFQIPALDKDLGEVLMKSGGQVPINAVTLYLFQSIRYQKKILEILSAPGLDEGLRKIVQESTKHTGVSDNGKGKTKGSP